jgi:hypothetical protein
VCPRPAAQAVKVAPRLIAGSLWARGQPALPEVNQVQ